MENRFIPLPGSVFRDDHGTLITVEEAAWNKVTFWRGETLCVLPGALFAKRMRLVDAPAHPLRPVDRPAVQQDHPLIQRLKALQGKQPASLRRRRAGAF